MNFHPGSVIPLKHDSFRELIQEGARLELQNRKLRAAVNLTLDYLKKEGLPDDNQHPVAVALREAVSE